MKFSILVICTELGESERDMGGIKGVSGVESSVDGMATES